MRDILRLATFGISIAVLSSCAMIEDDDNSLDSDRTVADRQYDRGTQDDWVDDTIGMNPKHLDHPGGSYDSRAPRSGVDRSSSSAVNRDRRATDSTNRSTTSPPARDTTGTRDTRDIYPPSGTNPPSSTTPPSGEVGAATLSNQDFVNQAASAGMFEVQSSELALQKASDQDVKDFAQQMITDHRKANDELTRISRQANLTVPMTLSPKHQRLLDELKGLSGDAFDRRYLDIQAQAHQEAIDLFSKAGRSVPSQEIKTFAQDALPTLNMHRDHVRRIHPTSGDSMTNP